MLLMVGGVASSWRCTALPTPFFWSKSTTLPILGSNATDNVANKKSATPPRADDSGHFFKPLIKLQQLAQLAPTTPVSYS